MKCDKCGSTDILQQISMMVDPNDLECVALVDANDFQWEDFFYCMECEDECSVGNEGHAGLVGGISDKDEEMDSK